MECKSMHIGVHTSIPHCINFNKVLPPSLTWHSGVYIGDTSPPFTRFTKLSRLFSPASHTGTRSDEASATTHLQASSLSPNPSILSAATSRAVASAVALA